MNRFFVPKENIGDLRIRLTDPEDVHHALRVLRLREGERVEIADGEAAEYVCALETASEDELVFRILDRSGLAHEPRTRVTLFQGYPKADKLDGIVRECTELGVSAIVPVYTARSVVRDSGKGEKKRERLRKIADSAAKQSKRGIIPEIGRSCDFEAVLGLLGPSGAAPDGADARKDGEAPFDLILIPYEDERGTTIKDVLRRFRAERTDLFGEGNAPRIAVIIGPEGGFGPSEVEAAKACGAIPVSLGRTILRTETAGPAAAAMVLYELEL